MRLFISYAHADVGQVKPLVETLRQGGHAPWFDHKLLPGQDWQAELLAAITACDAFVYALTPDSLASEWCQWEFARAVEMGKPVIPMLLRKCTLPKEISRFQYADFSEGLDINNVAKLMGGLLQAHIASYRVQNTPTAPQQPGGNPAQAVGTVAPIGMRDELKPLDVLHILPRPFEWCEIPAGMVWMDGGPFSIAHNFHMGKYPITESQYQKFIESPIGYAKEAWWDYSTDALKWRRFNPGPSSFDFQGVDLPRTNVTWYAAVAFCRWLSNELGYEVRLPTEQQWQRAAQGDDRRMFPWGNRFDYSLCNIRATTLTPVTCYPNGASPYGVMDMAGNICEWCLSKWETPPGTDYSLTGDSKRVLRGYPCYGSEYAKTKVTERVVYEPDIKNNANGFRIVTQFES